MSDPGVGPSVDIVILSWDRVSDTIEAVQSAISQLGIRQTIILVDQGTAQDELARLQRFCQGFSNVKLLTNSKNTGVPAGRNQAAKIGSSEYIVSLDNDAIFKDEYQVQKAVELLQGNDELAGLAFRIKIYSDDSDDRVSWPYPRDISVWAERSFAVAQVVGAGHAFRRSAFERVGGYDPRLFFMHEELDLGLRLSVSDISCPPTGGLPITVSAIIITRETSSTSVARLCRSIGRCCGVLPCLSTD